VLALGQAAARLIRPVLIKGAAIIGWLIAEREGRLARSCVWCLAHHRGPPAHGFRALLAFLACFQRRR